MELSSKPGLCIETGLTSDYCLFVSLNYYVMRVCLAIYWPSHSHPLGNYAEAVYVASAHG